MTRLDERLPGPMSPMTTSKCILIRNRRSDFLLRHVSGGMINSPRKACYSEESATEAVLKQALRPTLFLE